MRRLYVYILRCRDSSYYIGVTNDIEQRFIEHQNGIDPRCYTFERRPLILAYFEEYDSPLDAIAREKQLKGWSRAKKEALINQKNSLLPELSQNRSKNITP
jgi:putative endonuclease